MTNLEPEHTPSLAFEDGDNGDNYAPLRFERTNCGGLPPELVEPSRHGLETLWGFLLRTEPHTLHIMYNPVAGLIKDERRARKLATQMGSVFHVKQTRDPALAAAGLKDVGSYGPDVLERYFRSRRN